MKQNLTISITNTPEVGKQGRGLAILPLFDENKVQDLEHFGGHKEKYFLLLSYLYEHLTFDKRYKNLTDYVRISGKQITKITTPREREDLSKNCVISGLIEIDHSYKVGEYPKGYRLGKVLREAIGLLITDLPTRNIDSPQKACPVVSYLNKQLNRLIIDENALQYCIDKYNYCYSLKSNTSNSTSNILIQSPPTPTNPHSPPLCVLIYGCVCISE